MRILWVIHLYPPVHNCGSEAVAHAINKHLISKGHQVRVLLMQAGMHKVNVPYEFEGVQVMGAPIHLDGYSWGDALLTHLDFTYQAIQMGIVADRPVINFVHNSHRYDSVTNAQRNNYVVYNSQWIADELQYKHPSMVFPPPCDWRQYDIGGDPYDREYITLINLDENKGGLILKRLAAAMPERKFLAVRGSYSEPAEIGQVTDLPPNCTVINNSPDIMPVYRQTRILLMPSRYESWGRTATEAMCNGIPVICTGTPGLKENCGDAAVYIPDRGPIDRDKTNGKVLSHDGDSYNIKPLIMTIKSLDNKKTYANQSRLCRDRSRDLDPNKGLCDVEDFIINAVRNNKQPKRTRNVTVL